MSRLGAIGEALILLGLGAYLAWLSLSQDYWVLMNPKFGWLTLTTGVLLAALGVASLIMRQLCPTPLRLASFLVLAALVVTFDADAITPGSPGLRIQRQPAQASPRLTHNGVSYIKINTLELFALIKANDTQKLGEPYVVRGVVRRSPELDRRGEIALLRPQIYCCAADAVALGFRVKTPQYQDLKDNQWVRVLGRIKKLPKPEKNLYAPKLQGVFFSLFHEEAIIIADAVEPVSVPKMPYIFFAKSEEPYAY
ncbi:MAG: hypothetical protein PVG03_06520 [Desulfarculaceae bacterium]